MGTRLARRYHAREYTFLFSDAVINAAYGDLMARVASVGGFEYPQLFDEIYQAFDDGEWGHQGEWFTEQPVITYTDPAVAAIVARLDQSE